jgi:UDP-2,3-diacylglucosamine pyrophosphatase LpxH
MKIEALFISDIHLGSRGCNSSKLLEILKKYEPEYLFIVGDFIDGWLLKSRHYWTQEYTNIIKKILSYSKKGTKVVYITGNHDEFLRDYSDIKFDENILICDEYIWKHYFIVHGDLYDGVMNMKWLAHLGSIGYEIAIVVDRFIKKLGYKKSISKWLKDNVKEAVKFITVFEDEIVHQAIKRNCIGVICGHIHKPENKQVHNIHYLNCGDFIENNSYIIYDQGQFNHYYSV